MTKHYPNELKERAVRLVLDAESEPGGRRGACTCVGGQLGVNADTLRWWVVQFEINQGRRVGVKTADAQRIRELERENRELRQLRYSAVKPLKSNVASSMGRVC